jgi:hypothetical protein
MIQPYTENIHDYNLQQISVDNFRLPFCNTVSYSKSFIPCTWRLWNGLPASTKSSPSLNIFKTRLNSDYPFLICHSVFSNVYHFCLFCYCFYVFSQNNDLVRYKRPDYIYDMIQPYTENIHDYNLQQISGDNFRLPFCNTVSYSKSFIPCTLRLWNGLPASTKSSTSCCLWILYKGQCIK